MVIRVAGSPLIGAEGFTSMALEIDTRAPDFELPNQFGEHVRLGDFVGKKPVALVFFPLAFSSTCTSELCSLRDNLALFKENGVELIGISVDSKATLRAFAEQEGYDFTLLADFWPHGAVAKDYGVFLDEKGFATRATFVIDVRGIIRSSFITAPGQPRSLDEYRAALDTVLPARV
jgi:peroxiredoxin